MEGERWYEVLVIPLRFLLLNSTFIPLSLVVCMDLCKIYYAQFINACPLMFDAVSGTRAQANNTSISEDLGQIKYVFTDKTGTLTQNEMTFRSCSVRGVLHTPEQTASMNLTGTSDAALAATEFFRNFALNNTAVPVHASAGPNALEFSYRASSPDEVALVEAAARAGVVLTFRDSDSVHITVCGVLEKYKVLQVLDFNSDRKRMTVVLRNMQTNALLMLVKGADEVLEDKFLKTEATVLGTTNEHLNQFACVGLRTLMFAQRLISDVEFFEWRTLYDKASCTLSHSSSPTLVPL